MVYEITERTMSADGQLFVIPDVEINMYWTSLDVSDEDVIELYHNHAVCEQFTRNQMNMKRRSYVKPRLSLFCKVPDYRRNVV